MSKRASPDSKPVSRPSKQRRTVRQETSTEEQEDAISVNASWLEAHRLPFRDAIVGYQESFVDSKQATTWLQELLDLEDWFQPTLKMYGRSFTQSRSVIAYATTPFDLQYSGQSISMSTDWPSVVLTCKAQVESVLGCTFNHCMLNRYNDGSVHIGSHRDNKENKVIAAISLGAERDFIMTHDKHQKGQETDAESGQTMRKRWTLKNGSLVLMAGQTQAHWKHEIPKQLKIKSPRVSLTFRQMDFSEQQPKKSKK